METIRILHTNDLHSHFEHFPKIGRYLTAAQADKSVDQVYTFDAGDFMDRSHPLSDATKGQVNVELMNSFNYDVTTIGNNEGISNSHEALEHLFDHAQFSVVLANLFEEDETRPAWALPYKILVTAKGTRIALVGLTAAYPLSYGPNHWHVKTLKWTMDQILQQIKGQYDLLILLNHVGLEQDRWLAQHYPEITLIIGGHSHDLLEYGEKVNHTWITQTGKWGNYIGDIKLELNDRHELSNLVPAVVATASLPEETEDKATAAALYERGRKQLTAAKVAALPEKFAGNKQAAIAVSLDAISNFAGTELAMLSSGLFLTPFKAGVISKYDLQKALPHSMHVVKAKLKGHDLWRLVMEIEKNRHFLDQFPLQGMSFRGKIFGQMYYKGLKFDPAMQTVRVNGQKLDPNKEYEIAVLDHYVLVPFFPTLAIAGKNEFLFPKFLREVIGDYLAKLYPLEQGSK